MFLTVRVRTYQVGYKPILGCMAPCAAPPPDLFWMAKQPRLWRNLRFLRDGFLPVWQQVLSIQNTAPIRITRSHNHTQQFAVNGKTMHWRESKSSCKLCQLAAPPCAGGSSSLRYLLCVLPPDSCLDPTCCCHGPGEEQGQQLLLVEASQNNKRWEDKKTLRSFSVCAPGRSNLSTYELERDEKALLLAICSTETSPHWASFLSPV